MPPDLNSLPPSRSSSSSPFQTRTMQASLEDVSSQSPPPRSSVSLQAAATINAADLLRQSSNRSPRENRAAERRRSLVAMNLNLNDPTMPGPGELLGDNRNSRRGSVLYSPSSLVGSPSTATGDPHHHHRTPSLGEIHQELEEEQEAQVNRLLLMIRNQQAQIQQMQHRQNSANGTAVEDSTPTSERSVFFPPLPPAASSRDRRPSLQFPPTYSRRRDSDSTAPIPIAPRLSSFQSDYNLSAPDTLGLGNDGSGRQCSRDESAYYQAEAANLTRENQMLRQRIRELERQISELTASSPYVPSEPSNLTTSASTSTSAESLIVTPSITESEAPSTSQSRSREREKE
ncbi:predicted protein [Uncinocarpus reesii 1704]|uniref:Uncharacterized protein n=1 Tax=Uncinocarpus reesii (strain UAMH 1704) TaxID=336963 RepID=C4JXP6_UNCRE|nr:uncharacterized protein UREG_06419 [Uncinocarpus reesii 1704]EEP81554.1 predicted protein [Uncinocarpus reesii 1704]